jgi:hypothetical protein
VGSVLDALTWSGSGVELCLFVAAGSGGRPSLDANRGGVSLRSVRTSELLREEIGGGLRYFEVDIILNSIPDDLETYLNGLLTEALHGGAVAAWFAFEGSFHFDHLLTADIADQVFGVADASGVDVAVRDGRLRDPEWRLRVAAACSNLRALDH